MNKTIHINKYRLIPAALVVLGFTAALFLRGEAAAAGAATGLALCGRIVVPSLFPFLCAALFISKSGLADLLGRILGPVVPRLFRLPAAAAGPILLSFVAGYPVGARLTRGLYEAGQVTAAQANTMLLFTVNAGPAFVVTAVGAGMLHTSAAGWLLLAAHISASLLIGIGMGHIDGRHMPVRDLCKKPPASGRPANMAAFVEAVSDASASMLQICGWVVLFSVILALLRSSGLPAALTSLLAGLSEVTTGTAAAAASRNLPLIAALLGWGGLSVQFQSLSSLGKLRPNYGRFFAARAVHGLLSMGIAYILLRIFPAAVPTAADAAVRPATSGLSLPAALGLLLLMTVFLCFSSKGGQQSAGVRLWPQRR